MCPAAFLHTLPPALRLSSVTEQLASREAFGDSMAMLIASSDEETRTALLARDRQLG
jgi:hypothetical protein